MSKDTDAEAYKYGFHSAVEAVTLGRGLNEDVVRAISKARNEPEFMLNFRLKAFKHFQTMEEPEWSSVRYPPIDYQAVSYYSAPKQKKEVKSLDEVDPKLLETYDKLGVPLHERARVPGVRFEMQDAARVRVEHRIGDHLLVARHADHAALAQVTAVRTQAAQSKRSVDPLRVEGRKHDVGHSLHIVAAREPCA